MKKTILIAVSVLLALNVIFASNGFQLDFNFTCGYSANRALHKNPDGSMIMSGKNGNNLILVKYNSCFQEEWKQSYNVGNSGLETSVHDLGSNGYVVANMYSGNPASFVVLRTDTSGNLIWAKRFFANEQLVMNGVDVDVNGNIFISGSYYRVQFDMDFFMMLLDVNGNIIWNKTWGGGNGGSYLSWEQSYTGIATSDGGYMLAGVAFSTSDTTYWPEFPEYDNAVILKLDANGNYHWAKVIGGNIHDRIYAIFETTDGYIFGGTSSSDAYGGAGWDAYLFKISTDANRNFTGVDWAKSFGHPTTVNSEDVYSIAVNNGKIYAGGIHDNNFNFLVEFDMNGNFTGKGKEYTGFMVHSLLAQPDGGLLFADQYDWQTLRLTKVDSNLITGNSCTINNYSPSVKNGGSDLALPGSNIIFGNINGGSVQINDITNSVVAGAYAINRLLLCPNTSIIPSFSTANTTICPGDCIDFTNLTIGNALCYEWNFTGAVTTFSDEVHPSGICYNNTGSFPVQLTAYGINGAVDTVVNAYITVAGNKPDANFTVTINGGEVGFKNLTTGATSYLWNFDNNNDTSSLAEPNYTYTQNGDYTVCLFAFNTCDADTVCKTVSIVITGMENHITSKSLVSVYPNPVKEVLIVNAENLEENFILNITDINGKSISSEIISGKKPFAKNISAFSSGIYFAEVISNQQKFHFKFIKE